MSPILKRSGHSWVKYWSGAQKGEGFEYHLLAMALGIAILVAGGGAASIDRALSRAKPV